MHGAEHLVVMMVVPPLLVLGAPLTLLLRSVSPRARKEIVGILHDPAMKKVSGPVAGIGLTLEYHGTMFLVMLTGLVRLHARSTSGRTSRRTPTCSSAGCCSGCR